MGKYFLILLASVCFATSLALSDDSMHSGDGAKSSSRGTAIEGGEVEQNVEVERSDALSLIEAFKEVERGLGKRSTGEVTEVDTQ